MISKNPYSSEIKTWSAVPSWIHKPAWIFNSNGHSTHTSIQVVRKFKYFLKQTILWWVNPVINQQQLHSHKIRYNHRMYTWDFRNQQDHNLHNKYLLHIKVLLQHFTHFNTNIFFYNFTFLNIHTLHKVQRLHPCIFLHHKTISTTIHNGGNFRLSHFLPNTATQSHKNVEK